VLIVEDDPTIGHHLHLGLEGHGYPTAWCRTGAAALIHVRESSPKIVLLDLGLPDRDGVDLVRASAATILKLCSSFLPPAAARSMSSSASMRALMIISSNRSA
jgi:CheY-like chemotaxis protein